MSGVNINLYQFDYDLTFAALLMNADGTVYHRYGTRIADDASSRLSMKAFSRLLLDSLEDHREYMKNPSPPPPKRPLVIEEIPSMAKRLKQKQKIDCFHCHMVYDSFREDARAARKWSNTEIWKWPLPDQVGLLMDVEDPSVVQKVKSSSAAYRAKIRSKDRILYMENQRVRTHSDIQWVLQNASSKATSLRVVVERKGKEKELKLRLRKGWKVSNPETVSWRPTVWGYRPAPGFGGPQLKENELSKLGLAKNRWAFRITYLVTWGKNKKDGQNAMQAGLRRGDIILSVAGKSDFISVAHFHSWFRLTRKVGTRVEIRGLRNGKPKRFILKVLP